jgi:hypothetical protein
MYPAMILILGIIPKRTTLTMYKIEVLMLDAMFFKMTSAYLYTMVTAIPIKELLNIIKQAAAE